jgi:hypothetical protein
VDAMTELFKIAGAVKLPDAATSTNDGPTLWPLYGDIPWFMIGLLLIAGTRSFTLADIGGSSLGRLARSNRTMNGESHSDKSAISSEHHEEGADV